MLFNTCREIEGDSSTRSPRAAVSQQETLHGGAESRASVLTCPSDPPRRCPTQIEQLAIALLNSNRRFIWVLRDADRGDFCRGGKRRRQTAAGTGAAAEILAHEATAAFVSHCGWNSCMESISMGVPVVGWPMHSDQPRNAVFVSEYLKVGVVVRDWARREETVTAAEIEDAIKKVMVDDGAEEIRRRAKALGEAVRGAVADGGSSRTDFDAFIAHISR
ncbi:Zeatin O-glucosyltransferase [Ananas comosus]|uniref:Zeatin O-glucosyltransferase n=1 Tax=Ananas comosus TaxID=4615 RepID=A0A199VG72_ANACO|nr:Zeatin O-glucosyltransferase [Ananas comosus]